MEPYSLTATPKRFEIVLDYLRNGCTLVSDTVPDDLVTYVKADADYFGLWGLKLACDLQQMRGRGKDPICGILEQGFQIEREFPDFVVNGMIHRECQFLVPKDK
jgi:hypothetical protein